MQVQEWKSPEINELTAGMVKAQLAIQPAMKDAKNPAFKSRYATLASVYEAIAPALEAGCLAVFQTIHPIPGGQDDGGYSHDGLLVRTILAHKSGQWIASDCPMFPDMANPHKVGGAITYARRYGLAAIMGVWQEDDDGNLASGVNGHSNGYSNGNGNGRSYNSPPKSQASSTRETHGEGPPAANAKNPENPPEARSFPVYIASAAAAAGVEANDMVRELVSYLVDDGKLADSLRDNQQCMSDAGHVYMTDQSRVTNTVKEMVRAAVRSRSQAKSQRA